MDNHDLKLINLNPWDVPIPYKNHQVRRILEMAAKMEQGELARVDGIKKEQIWLLRSALWRQIRRHELHTQVFVRNGQMYLRKLGENGPEMVQEA